MDYQYETLLDERFQMLCQSLLIREHTGVQCFPVGMPDGGRDATAPESSGRIIYQVKFARNPANVEDPVSWVTKAIDGEVEKVKKLADRGATSFVLMTNMPGTSHLDVGRMDKVQAHIDKVLPIPGACWWRDDLDRRLDLSYDLKLKYPSLLSGTDLIRLLWESTGVGEDRQRRANALGSYFTDQSDRDSKVRFKQADLSPSPLFELFIDVPATPRRDSKQMESREKEYKRSIISIMRSKEDESGAFLHSFEGDYEETSGHLMRRGLRRSASAGHPVGAASLILSHAFGTSVSKIVLEGAPGQGKSTFAQYIAQVHRARILRLESVKSIPPQDAISPLMLPFKLELRDLATWLKGIDPWAPGESTQHGRPCTLEGALAAHIERYSGGVRFDVSDLLFVMGGNSVLIILDALDEVADLDDRQHVVDEVTAAATRLEGRTENSEIKFVITSRPTAIAGSPTFDSTKYFYLTLAAIQPSLAMTYTKKWAHARKLDDSDLSMLLATLGEKLEAPHMAELAKNTMQLSILLSLTHLRGSTLPDKRTELYDAYIDVFLNREAEKDRTVRENRELLVNIHRYLGYYLHAQAEVGGASGRISTEELREVLTQFLMRETAESHFMRQRVTELIDSLLTGVVERVVALVSRVQGTYEFEVQPLREYFAAKYLYETAPYAPATRRQAGTKPDRFDGIARNPYWMNVTRFFAGCFSMGELLDLAERTARLIEDSDPTETAYPRTLALCLMQDWVFTQSAASMKRIVQAVFDKPGIRWAAVREDQSSFSGYSGNSTDVGLSPSAGYENLVDLFWPMLTDGVHRESLAAICTLLMQQPEGKLVADIWYKEALRKSSHELGSWCVIGNWLGIFRELDVARFTALLELAPATERDLVLVSFAEGGGDTDRLPPGERHSILVATFNGAGRGRLRVRKTRSSLSLMHAVEPFLVARMLLDKEFGRIIYEDLDIANRTSGAPPSAYTNVSQAASDLARQDQAQGLDLWRKLVGEMRATFGKTWREIELANISASIKSPQERGAGASRLFDESRTLPDRMRNARRRARQTDWWRAQYGQAEGNHDLGMWLLATFSWSHPDCFSSLIQEVDEATQRLDDATYASVIRACDLSRIYGKYSRNALVLGDSVLRNLHWRTVSLIHDRLSADDQRDTALKFMRSRSRDDLAGLHFMDYLTSQFSSDEASFREALKAMSQGIRRGIVSTDRRYFSFDESHSKNRAIRENRSSIITNSWELPSALVSLVHSIPDTGRRFTPVMEIADTQNWFNS
ncbi:NACHT domain-containing protein [[Kitasatospora] papulosa]|uniref:NACHT domain-containing protein n=1 Tax=[Kitasatospora] papulosa TaxID=1464011 RepID=UPI0036A310A5